MTKENFQVNLRGIVEILSHHLYSSPRVYLRELIQNARDAVVARGEIDAEAPRTIEIVVDQLAGEIVVLDQGIGLTEDEMRSLLATIGASSKRRDFLAARRQYLGQFGIGLLSCFLIANQIEVRSRSARAEDAPTMVWLGSADGTYTVRRAEEPLERPGTEVRIHARPDDREWVSYSRVHLLARQFASLLEIPVVLRASGTPGQELVSAETPPWRLGEEESADWCSRELGFTPLAVLPIEVPAAGVAGVAYIVDSPGRVGNRRGDVVHSHGMFVSGDNTQLAPDWAYFVQLAIEAGELGLTASREALQESALLEQVRERIGDQIRQQVERLAVRDPDAFEYFMAVHDKGLLAMAASDQDMLDFVVRHVPWQTSEGSMTLHEITQNRGSALYVTKVSDFTSFAPLMRAQGKLLINGGYVYGREILQLADGLKGRPRDLAVLDVDKLLDDLPRPSGENTALAARIRAYAEPALTPLDVQVELRSFLPESTSALYIRSGGSFGSDELDDSDPWAALASEFQTRPAGPRLVLNVASPPVRSLAGELDGHLRNEAFVGLYVLGMLTAGETINERHQAMLSQSLRVLIDAATGPRGPGEP